MYKALYIEDEKTDFVVSLINEFGKLGVKCDFQDWADAAKKAKTSDNNIDFKKLYEILAIKQYDILLIDVMMPPKGIIGTNNGFLTGIILHDNLIDKTDLTKEKMTFFLTNLPVTTKSGSYYAKANEYANDILSDSLFSKKNPKLIAEKILATIKNNTGTSNE